MPFKFFTIHRPYHFSMTSNLRSGWIHPMYHILFFFSSQISLLLFNVYEITVCIRFFLWFTFPILSCCVTKKNLSHSIWEMDREKEQTLVYEKSFNVTEKKGTSKGNRKIIFVRCDTSLEKTHRLHRSFFGLCQLMLLESDKSKLKSINNS